jgi:hypothetical protein
MHHGHLITAYRTTTGCETLMVMFLSHSFFLIARASFSSHNRNHHIQSHNALANLKCSVDSPILDESTQQPIKDIT